MSKSHKYVGIKLKANTSLDRAAIAASARMAADQAHGNAWNSPGKVRFEKASSNGLDFSVQATGPFKRELMTFALTIKPAGEHSDLLVRIVNYKQARQTVLFIPITPYKLLGLAAYRDFLNHLADEIEEQDSDAVVEILQS